MKETARLPLAGVAAAEFAAVTAAVSLREPTQVIMEIVVRVGRAIAFLSLSSVPHDRSALPDSFEQGIERTPYAYALTGTVFWGSCVNKRHLGCWLLAVSLGLGSFCWPLFYPAWAQVQPPTTTPASCLAQPLPAPQDSDLLGLNLPDTITLCPLDQTVGAAYPAIPIIFSGVVGAYPGKLRMNLEPSQVTTNPNFDPFYGENRAGFEATCLKNGEPVPHCPLRLEILVERNSGSHDDDRKIVARPRGAIQLMNPGSGVSGTTINATFTTVAGEIVPPGAGQAATYDTETGDSGSFQFYYAAPEAAGLTKLTVHYFVGQADAPRPLSAEITVKVADPFLGVRGYNGTNGGSWHITEPYANSDRCHFYENYYARWGTHDRLNSTAEYFALILGGAAGVPLAPWSL